MSCIRPCFVKELWFSHFVKGSPTWRAAAFNLCCSHSQLTTLADAIIHCPHSLFSGISTPHPLWCHTLCLVVFLHPTLSDAIIHCPHSVYSGFSTSCFLWCYYSLPTLSVYGVTGPPRSCHYLLPNVSDAINPSQPHTWLLSSFAKRNVEFNFQIGDITDHDISHHP